MCCKRWDNGRERQRDRDLEARQSVAPGTSPMNKRTIVFASIGAILAIAVLGAFLDPTRTVWGYLRGDKFYQNRPTSYWRTVVAGEEYSELQSPEAVPVLAQMLKDRNYHVRGRAAVLLGQIGP